MCIYCGTTKYRKIYEQHYGNIPVDDENRSYHIHHIDGNRDNNCPTNLIAVSIQDHYNVHYAQGDWGACHRLAQLLRMSAQEISSLAKFAAEHSAKKAIENGTHIFIRDNPSPKRVVQGTHNFLGGALQHERYAKGTHPSQIKISCIHCGKICSKTNHTRFHGSNCNVVKERVMTHSPKGKKWFNNGEISTMAYICPPGFQIGRLKKKSI